MCVHADDKSRTALGYAANLIKVDSAALEKSLVGMDTVTRGEKIRRFYKTDGAYDCRDALSKVGAIEAPPASSIGPSLLPSPTHSPHLNIIPGAV